MAANGNGSKRKILCVDDELILAELCEERLQALGYEVVGMADAEKALQLFEKDAQYFDLLLVDHIMPNLTGTEFAKRVLTIRPEVPVLLVTGHEGAVSEEEAREVGIKEVLVKPLTTPELEVAIQRAFV